MNYPFLIHLSKVLTLSILDYKKAQYKIGLGLKARLLTDHHLQDEDDVCHHPQDLHLIHPW